MENLNCKTVVVVRYKEDVSWTERLNAKVEVVNKGVDMPDYGREASGFFFYIINHYEKLKGHYYFVQGDPFDHAPNIVNDINNTTEDLKFFGKQCFTCDNKGLPHHQGIDVGYVYKELFGRDSPKTFNFYVGGGQFCVSAKVIKSKPKSFYEKALKITEDYDKAPWVFERLWINIFDDLL